jgi:hypothetical protein
MYSPPSSTPPASAAPAHHLVHPVQYPQERQLPVPRWTDQRGDLTRTHDQRDGLQNLSVRNHADFAALQHELSISPIGVPDSLRYRPSVIAPAWYRATGIVGWFALILPGA